MVKKSLPPVVNDPLERVRGRLKKCENLNITMMLISNDTVDHIEYG